MILIKYSYPNITFGLSKEWFFSPILKIKTLGKYESDISWTVKNPSIIKSFLESRANRKEEFCLSLNSDPLEGRDRQNHISKFTKLIVTKFCTMINLETDKE